MSDAPPPTPPARSDPGMGPRTAAALVFGASAAVLVVELASLRLLAPYLGLTLETNTLVIGAALSAIAAGSWLGGRAADAVPPRRLIAPALGLSGAVVAVTPVVLRVIGEVAPVALLLTALITVLVPGALLSAVTPLVVKLRLSELEHTGSVVGSLSGIGTAGAIVGTVVTGFVLISRVPVSGILIGLGIALVVAALLMAREAVHWSRASQATAVALVVAGSVALPLAPGGCDRETTYHCVVVTGPDETGARTLVLDGLRHSSVVRGEPTVLPFAYARAIAASVDAHWPGDQALRAYHIGGGGLSIPRYLRATRPGSTNLVSEVDGGVVATDEGELGLDLRGIDVRVEDGRLGLRRLPDDSRDLVVGDAFGGVSVPWHLTTRETVEDISRVLAPRGLYAVNLIDYPPTAFARAEVATLRTVFDHVTVIGPPGAAAGVNGGNLVALASDAPLPTDALPAALMAKGVPMAAFSGRQLDRWVGDSPVLTDDYAPVDQLLTTTFSG